MSQHKDPSFLVSLSSPLLHGCSKCCPEFLSRKHFTTQQSLIATGLDKWLEDPYTGLCTLLLAPRRLVPIMEATLGYCYQWRKTWFVQWKEQVKNSCTLATMDVLYACPGGKSNFCVHVLALVWNYRTFIANQALQCRPHREDNPASLLLWYFKRCGLCEKKISVEAWNLKSEVDSIFQRWSGETSSHNKFKRMLTLFNKVPQSFWTTL